MHDAEHNSGLGSVIAFGMGAMVGAAAALLLTPQSGIKTRKLVRQYATKAAERIAPLTQDAQATVKTALKSGKEAVEGIKEQGQHAYATGKEAVTGLAKEMKDHG